jgi:hypothetical protein
LKKNEMKTQSVFAFPRQVSAAAKFSPMGMLPPGLMPPGMVNVSIPLSAPAFPPQVAMMPIEGGDQKKMQGTGGASKGPEDEGDLTPRGNHRYPPRKPWKPYRIAAWIALILAFLSVVVVGIQWGFKDYDGDRKRWVRQEHFESMQLLLTETRNDMSKMNKSPMIAPRGPLTSPRRHNHTHAHSISFDLTGEVRKFTRWPPLGQPVLKQIDFARLVWTRLCCHVNNHMFVCDSGQGAATNVGLECIVRYSNAASEQGAYLLIYVQHEDMVGAHCSFSWQISDKAADINLAASAPGLALR